jgi:predicted aspartyl protease
MPPYNDRIFTPPAAVLNARLRNPQNGTIIPDVLLLIDTGADVTLLPRDAVKRGGDRADRRLVRVTGVRRHIEHRWCGPR